MNPLNSFPSSGHPSELFLIYTRHGPFTVMDMTTKINKSEDVLVEERKQIIMKTKFDTSYPVKFTSAS